MPEPCTEHRNFQPSVHVQILNDKNDKEDMAYMMLVEMVCGDCETKFWWPGVQIGQSFNEPRVTPDKTKAILPMRPQGVLVMAMDDTPDIGADGKPETVDKEERLQLVIKALQAPQGYALQVPNEHLIHFRARAILNALGIS